MKKRLWIFGDSYSYKWELPGPYKDSGQHDYTKYFFEKYNKFPTHFSDILNDEFGFDEVINYADRGSDNYTILEKVGKHINDIQPDDYITIGWSEVSRYRLIWKKQNVFFWYRLFPNTPDAEWKQINQDHPAHVTNRDCYLTYNEIKNWQNILKKALPKNTIFWTPFWSESMKKTELPFLNINDLRTSGKLTTIKEETNNEQLDTHFGNDGMETIGNWMVGVFKNNTYINGRII